ncbi:hypothetical protein CH063_00288 [Colletotrichum higginsianum]|uniref:Zn(2)-C6 fungal-type domain-containing protein n=1 Tax=Colletotrichum higginsianum (strain IMI 349063) TaxID=759273 RepID=H1VE69_COLHI|nr:hypothetical protein CH063_00288 [Colletotrichum higginsianum]
MWSSLPALTVIGRNSAGRPDEVRNVDVTCQVPPTTTYTKYSTSSAISMSATLGRKKSCASCRISKARCSLDSPCRRCEERNLDCKYDHPPRRPAAYRALRPLQTPEGSSRRDIEETRSHVERSTHRRSPPPGPLMENHIDHLDGPSMNWDTLLSPSFLQLSPGCELGFSSLLSPSSSDMRLNTFQGLQAPPESGGVPWIRNGQQSGVPDHPEARSSLGSPPSIPTARSDRLQTQARTCLSRPPRRPFYQDRPFALRPNKVVAACFTVKVLMGQLLAYPKMMAKGGRLPPFIFPPCVVEGNALTTDCCSTGYHKCLPETLAICCNLVQSFEARTAGSASFVWKSIYKEVGRLQNEHDSYNCEELLQALQAVVIYILLQAGDPDSVPYNDIAALVSAPESIAKSLHTSSDYTVNLTNSTKIDRREWVIRESVRR